MLKLTDAIELKTNDNKVLSLATRYLVQQSYTFNVTLKSDLLSGTSHFCVHKDQLAEFCNASGSSRLDDTDSDGFIEIIKNDDLGHFTINAQIGGSTEEHVKASFNTDQTAVTTFLGDLKKLLKYEDKEGK